MSCELKQVISKPLATCSEGRLLVI